MTELSYQNIEIEFEQFKNRVECLYHYVVNNDQQVEELQALFDDQVYEMPTLWRGISILTRKANNLKMGTQINLGHSWSYNVDVAESFCDSLSICESSVLISCSSLIGLCVQNTVEKLNDEFLRFDKFLNSLSEDDLADVSSFFNYSILMKLDEDLGQLDEISSEEHEIIVFDDEIIITDLFKEDIGLALEPFIVYGEPSSCVNYEKSIAV